MLCLRNYSKKLFIILTCILSETDLNQTVDFDFAQTELMLNEFQSLGGTDILFYSNHKSTFLVSQTFPFHLFSLLMFFPPLFIELYLLRESKVYICLA